MTKKARLLTTLRAGRRITADQAVQRFRFAHRNSFYATVSKLRDEGFDIMTAPNKNGSLAYSL